MKKEELILTNMKTVNKQNFIYSSITFNGNKVQKQKSYKELLQNKLEVFNELICGFFPKTIDYLIKYIRKSGKDVYEYELLTDIYEEYRLQWEDRAPLIDNMINEINEKMIKEKEYEYLISIIDYQEKMTRRLITEMPSIDKIEFVFNHVKNVPFYLESDLELDNLQDVILESSTANIIEHNTENETNIYKYTPLIKKGKYQLGA